ncbi:MAG TPA: GDP-L-fucose synthase [Candidatus Cloacimonadota bacterium]|jgi:GDP-L-fucose synthase|nr:GDP-L-fucose synthase [Candidatus Cloacimonadota bacterium]HOF59023.1 GDP-L-fucose synthase [Candidatus Cloacimonadota bacterium]HOR58177.1 GDP-L-fucose synthase [Candidatus Cloacimonadota bacterium]HPL22764.1 GDP-L-fucose synthase [Candidatus Cloacimonadota bacterium]HQL13091.1 GDP-L-fucose synthase [Candidatus Cloacimonadota bacterium]
MKKQDRIYVAGNTGLVGSAIVRSLENQGYENLLFSPWQQYDLRNQATVVSFFEKNKPDYVIIAAAKVGGIYANEHYPAEFIYDNIMIEANIINAAHEHNVKKLLFLGSSCIYPRLCPQPIKEEYLLTGELEPTNEAYAIAKIAGIKLCQYYRKQYGDDFISAMPTNLFGPGDNYHLKNSHVLPALIRKIYLAKLLSQGQTDLIIKNFLHHEKISLKSSEVCSMLQKYGINSSGNGVSIALWGTGKPRREFLYVDDLADALIYLMHHYSEEEHINVGMGKDNMIQDIADMVSTMIGYKDEIVWDSSMPDGTPQKLLDVSKLFSTGWRPSYTFKEALSLTVDDYISQFQP